MTVMVKNRFDPGKIISSIWNEFVYGGHLLSLGASGIVLTVIMLINKPVSMPVLIIAYLITQIVYTLDHHNDIYEDNSTNPERARHLSNTNHNLALIIMFYVSALFMLLFFFGNIETTIFIIILGILGAIYPKNLTKKIVGFKNYYVAFLWATSAITLPYMFYSAKLDPVFCCICIFIFLKFLLSTVFFDIKDIKNDRQDKLKTIPVVLGLSKTLRFLHKINVFTFLLLTCSVFLGILPPYAVALALFFFYDLYYILRGGIEKSAKLRYISYIIVDGEYTLWPIVLVISKYYVG